MNPIFAGVEAKVEKDIRLEIEKAISEQQVTQTNAMLPTLHQLVDFVDKFVVDFKPLFRNVYERSMS
jgi:hypothetical protein